MGTSNNHRPRKIHGLDKFGNLDEIANRVNENTKNDKLFEDYHSLV